ncbi:MAG TPA: protein PilN, partial [Cupriavidus sp.]|nr:protein PilN [Cupriavidus sp.]
MKLKHIIRPATGAALVCTTLSGCVSPTLLKDVRQTTDATTMQITQTTEDLYARIRRDRAAVEAEQEVNRPFLAGKRVPVARNVTLPVALRKDVDTLVVFPERSMSLAVAAQRVQMATGIPVKIESDVYLPPNLLLPLTFAAQAQQQLRTAQQVQGSAVNPLSQGLGPAPALNSPLPSALTAGGGVGATQATALLETPLNVEFKNSEKMPLANMLDLIATRLGINWEYNAEKGLVRFYRLVTKTWQLPMAGGTNSFTTEFKQSAEGGSSGGGSGGSGQSAQIDAAAKAEIKEQNDLEGVKKSILPAMTMVGSAELNPATGVLTLRDTKEAVDAADEIIRKQIAIYSRMVTLKFQMIDLTVSDAGEAGVDWNVVLTKALQNLPGFTVNALSPATLVSSTAGGVGLGITSGGFNGTQAIV